jgi:hypothetical protein
MLRRRYRDARGIGIVVEGCCKTIVVAAISKIKGKFTEVQNGFLERQPKSDLSVAPSYLRPFGSLEISLLYLELY